MSSLTIQGMQHLGLPVTDLDRSISFYENLEFEKVFSTSVNEAEGITRVAMLKNGTLTIELYQKPDPLLKEISSRSDGHIDHIAIDVANIEAALNAVSSLGIVVLEQNAPVFLPFWDKGVKYFTVRGPDGEKVEFNQRL